MLLVKCKSTVFLMRQKPTRETFLFGRIESHVLKTAIESGIACSKSDAVRKAISFWGEHHGITPQRKRKRPGA